MKILDASPLIVFWLIWLTFFEHIFEKKSTPEFENRPTSVEQQSASFVPDVDKDRVFLGCLLANHGKIVHRYYGYDPDFKMTVEYEEMQLKFYGITMEVTGKGNCYPEIQNFLLMDIKNRSPHEIVVQAIKHFGKHGILKENTGPFAYPETCKEFTAKKDINTCILTLELRNKK